jgi:DNA-directed RNA polymerase specialized sigma24 family protein
MSVEQVYDRLRSIGCSVETSDALASIVAELSDKKREAFFLWAMGFTWEYIQDQCKISSKTIASIIYNVKRKAK